MDELLQHLMENPSFVKGVGLGERSKETIDREWTNLATRLNAHGNGATKTGQRWKRYWADLKFKTKNKVSTRRREAFSTGGGGPATLEDLSENDKKLLSIIGEGAVFGDTQYRVPILVSSTESSVFNTLSTSTQSACTNIKENEDYHNEVIVTATESPPPASFQAVSPSTRGNTSRVNTTEATAGSPRRPATSRRIFESPVSRRQLPQPRRGNSSTLTREVRTGLRVDQSWVVELERRRVDAESRLADAAMITAEAARVQAEAARMQAEAARMQAEAARMQAEAARMQAEAARDQAAAFNKLLEIYLKK